MAVGSYTTSTGHSHGLAETWNGSAWTIRSVPIPPGGTDVQLNAVSCSAANACTAAGSFSESTGQSEPLAGRWDGTSWTIQSVPTPVGATSGSLKGVSCTNVSACTAVGQYSAGSGQELTLSEMWNGTVWAIQTTPNPVGALGLALNGVSCTNPVPCIAVGSYSTSTSGFTTLAERWDGKNWTLEKTPNPVEIGGFNGDSCSAAGACTGVGDFFVEKWNGASWTEQSPADPKADVLLTLAAVSCIASAGCTAVGTGGYAYIPTNDYLGGGAFSAVTVPIAERGS